MDFCGYELYKLILALSVYTAYTSTVYQFHLQLNSLLNCYNEPIIHIIYVYVSNIIYVNKSQITMSFVGVG